jgi:uncharacterized membrane protein (UPF0127 family)
MAGQAIVTIKDKQWTCWVDSTPAELASGLSGVPSIPVGTGMLFILPQEQVVAVTAEGMLFPLSVIFIGEDLRVTEVALLLAPGDHDTTSLPCRYFLEVNVGEADDINPGDVVSISFSAPPTLPVTDWMAPAVTLAGMVMVGAFMAKMGKAMADALLVKPKEKPVLYGPRGELLLQTGRSTKFKPGEIVKYKGERVRVSEQIGDWVNIFIPSRQESVRVKPEALERIEDKQTAVIPTEPRRTDASKDEMEFLPDSPEFLAYTIEDIGYRQKIDAAFEQAIARARARAGGGK